MARRASGELFVDEARREGRTVAVLRGIAGEGGAVTVEAEIYPVSAPANADPQVRPYPFDSRREAEAFRAETLLALEYLGCNVAR